MPANNAPETRHFVAAAAEAGLSAIDSHRALTRVRRPRELLRARGHAAAEPEEKQRRRGRGRRARRSRRPAYGAQLGRVPDGRRRLRPRVPDYPGHVTTPIRRVCANRHLNPRAPDPVKPLSQPLIRSGVLHIAKSARIYTVKLGHRDGPRLIRHCGRRGPLERVLDLDLQPHRLCVVELHHQPHRTDDHGDRPAQHARGLRRHDQPIPARGSSGHRRGVLVGGRRDAYTVACDPAPPELEVLGRGSDRALRTHPTSLLLPETERGGRCLSGVGAGGKGSCILDDASMRGLVVVLGVSEERMEMKFAERMDV
ncbi:hypothetical protein DL765_006786 [Monosporascus sp. GIB2]|nr:hypothetical protein DL765_006786 [Monosporascus sp. GIB2]